jgi:hypothetical protein
VGSLAASAAARVTADQADDLRDSQQIHLLYVLPSDGSDRGYDTDGSITTSFAVAQNWLGAQGGGHQFNLDTAAGVTDVTFVRVTETDAQLASYGLNIRDHLESDLRAAGFSDPWKIYLAYYDGTARNTCGGGAFPPSLPGHVAALYLRGNFDDAAVPPCDSNPFATAGQPPGYREYSAIHEIIHTLGFVPSCAPHNTAVSHVSDSPQDLMYAGPQAWTPDTLDVGRDDYFSAHIPGCPDLADSGFLQGNASHALPGETAPGQPPTSPTPSASMACLHARSHARSLKAAIHNLRLRLRHARSGAQRRALRARLRKDVRRYASARRRVANLCPARYTSRATAPPHPW